MIYTGMTALIWCTANNQLAALIEGNRINREAFTAVQRAFIVVSPNSHQIAPMPGTSENGALVFTPIIKNSGNTPTKDLEIISIPTPEDNFIVMDEATRSQNYSVAVTTALKNGHRLNAPADPARLFSMGTV